MSLKTALLRMKNYSLEFTVFVCGAAVMIFELIGSRIIGPYVGTSIYAWTSLIGVILASLSLGYYFGGWLADKKHNVRFLGAMAAISAVLICFTAIFKDAGALLMRVPLPLEIKSVILSLLLFAPASFVLGMVSPYAVKLRVNNLETIGRDTGNLYAFSTFGSIFGTFLAGFYIIPNFGSTTSLFLISASLIITSILLLGKKNLSELSTIVFISSAIFFIIFSYFLCQHFKNFLIADVNTQYNRIWVYGGVDSATKKPTINFSTDPFGTQAAVFADKTSDLVFDYTKFFRVAGYFNPKLQNALMIGGCVYTYPRDFIKNFPNSHMDIVEIDPAMTQIAKQYFYFTDSPRLTIFHQDGRIFLNENKNKYDVIFNDAFNSASSVPFQLTTKEAVQEEFDALNNDGTVLSNIVSAVDGNKGKFLRAEYATYKAIFPQVFVFSISGIFDSEQTQNLMLVATKSKRFFNFKTADKEFDKYLTLIWNEPIESDLPILTDDFAPVEYYQRKAI